MATKRKTQAGKKTAKTGKATKAELRADAPKAIKSKAELAAYELSKTFDDKSFVGAFLDLGKSDAERQQAESKQQGAAVTICLQAEAFRREAHKQSIACDTAAKLWRMLIGQTLPELHAKKSPYVVSKVNESTSKEYFTLTNAGNNIVSITKGLIEQDVVITDDETGEVLEAYLDKRENSANQGNPSWGQIRKAVQKARKGAAPKAERELADSKEVYRDANRELQKAVFEGGDPERILKGAELIETLRQAFIAESKGALTFEDMEIILPEDAPAEPEEKQVAVA